MFCSQELLGESEQLKQTQQEVTTLSQTIIAFLGEVHESQSVIVQLQSKLNQIAAQFKMWVPFLYSVTVVIGYALWRGYVMLRSHRISPRVCSEREWRKQCKQRIRQCNKCLCLHWSSHWILFIAFTILLTAAYAINFRKATLKTYTCPQITGDSLDWWLTFHSLYQRSYRTNETDWE